MFGKSFIVATALTFAGATLARPGPMFECPVGSPQCCHSWRSVDTFDPGMLPPPNMPSMQHWVPEGSVGFACKAVGEDMTCKSNTMPLCCKMNDFGGILTFGCTEAKPSYYPSKPYYPPGPPGPPQPTY